MGSQPKKVVNHWSTPWVSIIITLYLRSVQISPLNLWKKKSAYLVNSEGFYYGRIAATNRPLTTASKTALYNNICIAKESNAQSPLEIPSALLMKYVGVLTKGY